MKQKTEALYDIALLCTAILIYHLFWWNRFLPIQEGWFLVYSHLIHSGQTLYKDFYFFLQPLYPLIIAAITFVFGEHLIVLRAFGLIEKMALTGVLYLLFRQLVNRPRAVLITAVTIVIYASNTTDVIYSYYQTSLFFGLLSAYLVCHYLDKDLNHINQSRALLLAAGFTGGIAFLVKQTTGLFIPLALMGILSIYGFKQYRRFNRYIFIYGAGFLSGPFIMAFWLFKKRALSAYVSQVWISGSASKGSLVDILFGFIMRQSKWEYISLLFVFILCLMVWLFIRKQEDEADTMNDPVAGTDDNKVLLITIFLMINFVVAYFIESFSLNDVVVFYLYKRDGVKFVFYFIVFMLFVSLYRSFSLAINRENIHWFVLTAVAFGVMYAHGMSYIIEEHSMVPALGLLLAALFKPVTVLNKAKNNLIYLLTFIVIFFCGQQRYVWPYDWWGWREPSVRTAVKKSDLPGFRGMFISPGTEQVFREVTELIKMNTSDSDSIYIFPHMPIFYFLSGRYPITFAKVHYFDVCSDSCAEKDARKLAAEPPKVIVMEQFPADAWLFHETAFRKGRPSGQRRIYDTINELIKEKTYRRVGSFDSPSDEPEYRIDVWVRPGNKSGAISHNNY